MRNQIRVAGLACALAFTGMSGFANAGVDEPTLFGVDQSTGELVSINPDTGAATVIGPTGWSDLSALTYDKTTDTLFAIDLSSRNLLSIDPETGTATVVVFMPADLYFQCLAADDDGTLYTYAAGYLRTINKDTGATPQIGNPGAGLRGLTYDSSTEQLFGVELVTDTLRSIDPDTGAGTLVGFTSTGAVSGLAMGPSGDVLYGVDAPADLETFDPATADPTFVGDTGLQFVTGLTYAVPVPDDCPGDANGDQMVDFDDLTLVLGNFGSMGGSGDVDGDSDVDFDDLTSVLGNFGSSCP